jgi:integrative and conjugative element protein (TIGR02256 family)
MHELSIGEGLVFRRLDGSGVKVGPGALLRMLAFRQTHASHTEAGGILLGRYIVGCRDVVVDEVTVPMQGDRRMRFAFHRSPEHHQEVIDSRWAASRGTCQYLGEWHTHPQLSPTPSSVDISDWRRRLRVDQFDGDSLLFVIVGIREVRVWEGSRRAHAIAPLQLADA